MVPSNLTVNQGDDIQVHVKWLSDSNEFTMQVTDTTTNQMTQVARHVLTANDRLDLSSAEYIVERPTTKDNKYIHQLRNFYGWNVKSAQAATNGGNTIGLQNYPWTRLNIYDKSSGHQLEATYPLDGDGFFAAWEDCD